mmetsp:Transcript_13680/g.20557  ORF Transcript_13680/g.20557 Transcript_13680/m.20557 type:complete len:290 (+) Transcript_13680:95-964(+)
MVGLLLVFLLSIVTLSRSLSLGAVERYLLNKRLGDIQLKTREQFGLSLKTDKASDLVLIFPGAGGPDKFTDELETTLTTYLNKKKNNAPSFMNLFSADPKAKTVVKTLDWQDFRGSILTAAYDSEAFGEEVGSILCNQSIECNSIHCVGISVGAFAANACISILKKKRSENEPTANKPYLRLTLLDPFTSRGVGGSGYGNTYFGLEADYAEQYLNTDDPVPSTNEPLSLCTTYDVTGAPERDDFELPENESMHRWPLVYFARYGYKNSAGKILEHGKDGFPSRSSVILK